MSNKNAEIKISLLNSEQKDFNEKSLKDMSDEDSQVLTSPSPYPRFTLLSQAGQDFLDNIGLTLEDLRSAKIDQETFEQLLNKKFTRRLLRWLALDDLLLKSFMFPFLDERGIQQAII